MKKLIRFISAAIICLSSLPIFVLIFAIVGFIEWISNDQPDWKTFNNYFFRNPLYNWLTFK